jgi:hypothetical protein
MPVSASERWGCGGRSKDRLKNKPLEAAILVDIAKSAE